MSRATFERRCVARNRLRPGFRYDGSLESPYIERSKLELELPLHRCMRLARRIDGGAVEVDPG